MSDKLKIEHSVVVIIAESSDPASMLEVIINSHPEEIREELAIEYGKAITEYSGKAIPLQITQDLGPYNQSEIVKTADPHELQLMKCPTCGGMHFRHAGYVLPLLPYSEGQKPKVGGSQVPVYVCVKDRTSFIHHDSKIQIVSDFIDLEAWEKFEKVAHKATGSGGQC